MVEIAAILLLSGAAMLLNAHAARIADRSSARRARLEESWAALIAGHPAGAKLR